MLPMQVIGIKKKHGLDDFMSFVLQVEGPMWRLNKLISWRI